MKLLTNGFFSIFYNMNHYRGSQRGQNNSRWPRDTTHVILYLFNARFKLGYRHFGYNGELLETNRWKYLRIIQFDSIINGKSFRVNS